MKNIKIKLNDLDDDINKSSNLLNGMLKTSARNKKKIIIFGILLFIIITIILFYKIFK